MRVFIESKSSFIGRSPSELMAERCVDITCSQNQTTFDPTQTPDALSWAFYTLFVIV